MLKKLILDIGHGGKDPGASHASADGTMLHEYNLAAGVAHDAMQQLMEALGPEQLSYINAGDPADPISKPYPIDQRAQDVAGRTDIETLVVSLHLNLASDVSTSGAEAFFYKGNAFAQKTAISMLETYCKATGLKNRGAKDDTQTHLGGLAIMRVPAHKDPRLADSIVLIELGFVSCDADVKIIRTKAAGAIVAAILKILNLPVPPPMIPGPFPDVDVNDYAAGAIKRMAESGIITGYGDGMFRPDKPLTRREMAVVADRIMDHVPSGTERKDPLHYPRDRV